MISKDTLDNHFSLALLSIFEFFFLEFSVAIKNLALVSMKKNKRRKQLHLSRSVISDYCAVSARIAGPIYLLPILTIAFGLVA